MELGGAHSVFIKFDLFKKLRFWQNVDEFRGRALHEVLAQPWVLCPGPGFGQETVNVLLEVTVERAFFKNPFISFIYFLKVVSSRYNSRTIRFVHSNGTVQGGLHIQTCAAITAIDSGIFLSLQKESLSWHPYPSSQPLSPKPPPISFGSLQSPTPDISEMEPSPRVWLLSLSSVFGGHRCFSGVGAAFPFVAE